MSKLNFLNCQIDISKKVFEPRAETEFWVGKEILNLKGKELDVLDIFSGSGCVGIAVLKKIKNSRVDFIDISNEAIEQVKINLKLNKVPKERYMVYKSDLFKSTKKNYYDFIFANPPYVALGRINEVQKEVLEIDPGLALFAGKNVLDIIRKFLPEAKKHLKKGGKLFMEFDPKQKMGISVILKKLKLRYRFKKDQFNKIRWVEATMIF
jgi:release factor glutamine methyltransferase